VISEQLILTIERLLVDLAELAKELRSRFKSADRPVRGGPVSERAAELAEIWMVQVAPNGDVRSAIEDDYLADLTVHFQRLLTASEKATSRGFYEKEIRAILKNSRLRLVIPLKQMRGESRPASLPSEFAPTAFVAHSFSDEDMPVVASVIGLLEALGIQVVTGERPRASSVSEKVKVRIEAQHIFVGIFTRRDKLSGKTEWVTSPWLIDEKAYAVGQGKSLILLRERGVSSLGGIQGDYEYIEFSRADLESLMIQLLQLFELRVAGLA
jgi:hypothetical protein